MRPAARVRSATALVLLALLGVLGTGLPSHSHPTSEPAADAGVQMVGTDHHSHGTQLVAQDERAPSGGLELAVPATLTVVALSAAVAPVEAPELEILRPMERAPPPGAPRAPPSLL